MLIGAMNHPGRDILTELKWMAEMSMDFVDLTLEPPIASSWLLDVKGVRRALEDYHLGLVGHTAYYLPLASPFEPIRRAAVEELKRCADIFGALGARWMNVHPGRQPPLHDWPYTVERNLQTLRELLPSCRDCGVGLMIENLPGEFNTPQELGTLLDALPEIGLHLDIGHANLMVKRNVSDLILAAYGSRLRHVHLHDNKGGAADLHLPLGTGTVNLLDQLRLLRSIHYDGTITLEVFTSDPKFLAISRDTLRRTWEEAAADSPATTVKA